MLPQFHIIQTRKYYHSIRPDIRFHSIPITSVIWDAINLVGVDDEQVNMSINAASSSSNYAMLLLHSCTLENSFAYVCEHQYPGYPCDLHYLLRCFNR